MEESVLEQDAENVVEALGCPKARDGERGEAEEGPTQDVLEAEREERYDDHRYDFESKPVSEYTSREVGLEGERLAASYLEKRGYGILERNWRCRGGEVDIIAEGDDGIVLVEVKTRLCLGEDRDSMPELAVDKKKQRRYRRLALFYLAEHYDVSSIRFDVIAVNIVGERQARLRHLLGAFQWDD